jgi:hypothetical protein
MAVAGAATAMPELVWATIEPVPTGGTVRTVLLRIPYVRISSLISGGRDCTNLLCEYPSHWKRGNAPFSRAGRSTYDTLRIVDTHLS